MGSETVPRFAPGWVGVGWGGWWALSMGRDGVGIWDYKLRDP